MNIEQIKKFTLQTFQEKKITSFPFSCLELLKLYGIPVFSYTQLREKNEELYSIGIKFSNDAFTFNHLVCYNDKMPKERTRFSLMHELGHILLDSQVETDANYFASLLLAPRIVLHQAPQLTESDIQELFFLSRQCANVVYSDYIKNYKGRKLNELSEIDLALYQHFYNKEKDFFIYKISECSLCEETIYNSLKNTCWRCQTEHRHFKKTDTYFDSIENSWLFPD